MQRNLLGFTLLALSLALLSTSAFSQPHAPGSRMSDRSHGRPDQAHNRHNDRHDDRRNNWHQERREDRRHDARPQGRPQPHVSPPHQPPQVRVPHRYHPPHPVKHAGRFHRGAPLPKTYPHPHYVIHDWHQRHLHRPPHGHHWVFVDNHYLLVAIATGIIVDILITDY